MKLEDKESPSNAKEEFMTPFYVRNWEWKCMFKEIHMGLRRDNLGYQAVECSWLKSMIKVNLPKNEFEELKRDTYQLRVLVDQASDLTVTN